MVDFPAFSWLFIAVLGLHQQIELAQVSSRDVKREKKSFERNLKF